MNSVNLIGNIGHDLDLRYTSNGKAVLNFSIGVRAFGDKTDWFRINAWENQAENVAKFCGKGSKVGVTGTLTTNEFTGKDGQKVKNVEIRAFQVDFLDSKEEREQRTRNQGNQNTYSDGSPDPFAKSGDPIDISDSDLPFD